MIEYRLWCSNKSEWEKNDWTIFPDGRLYDPSNNEFMSRKTHILERFTGLTDKNGTKIFEGDTCRIDGIEGISVVVFDSQMASFRIKTELKYHDGTFICFGFEETEPSEEIEVVGNIHDEKQEE